MVVQRGPNKSFFQSDKDSVNALGVGVGHFANSSSPVIGSKIPGGGFPDNRICGDTAPTLTRPRDENGKSQLLPIGYRRFRRLTPTECERLQGWPDLHTAIGLYRSSDLPKSRRNGDEYTMGLVSDTQRYRMTGNGVTADVVREIVKKMIRVGCFE